jgi:hypothetical protein
MIERFELVEYMVLGISDIVRHATQQAKVVLQFRGLRKKSDLNFCYRPSYS